MRVISVITVFLFCLTLSTCVSSTVRETTNNLLYRGYCFVRNPSFGLSKTINSIEKGEWIAGENSLFNHKKEVLLSCSYIIPFVYLKKQSGKEYDINCIEKIKLYDTCRGLLRKEHIPSSQDVESLFKEVKE